MSRNKSGAIIGNRILEILKEKDMTQQELADLSCNGNAPFIHLIANGSRKNISLPVAIRISTALGKSVEEVFIYGKEEKSDN